MSLRHSLSLLFLAGLSSAPAHAVRVSKSDFEMVRVPYDINIRDYQFPSGLRIVFQEDHTRPLVNVSNVIEAGAMDDPPGMDGFAHLIEHLNFRARHGDLPKNMDLIRQIGGGFNANTWLDRTIYLSLAPRDALVPLLRLESLRLMNAVQGVTEEVMLVEREVVRNELRGNLEQGPGDIFSNLQEQLFHDDHPYRYTTIGTHEGLNNVTMEVVQEWTLKYYTPDRSTIVVVGDFNLDEAGNFIQEAFLPEQLVDPENPDAELTMVDLPVRISGPSEEPPPPVSQELKSFQGMVEDPVVVLGWSLPGAFRQNHVQWDMTVRMMNVAMGKYLFPDWDYENEEIESFGCSYWPLKVNAMAVCYIEISDAEDAQKYVDDALNGLYELWNTDNYYQAERGQYVVGSLPIDRYFTYAKAELMAQTFRTVENVASVGGARGQELPIWLHYTGDPMYYSTQFGMLAGVDPRTTAELAHQYLNRERHAAVVIEPLDEEAKAKAERKGMEGQYDGMTRDDRGAMLFAPGELTDEVISQAIVPASLEKARHFTLDNGLEVVIVPFGSAPMARAELLTFGGTKNLGSWGLGDMALHYMEREYSFPVLEFAGSRYAAYGATTSYFQEVGSAGNVRAMVSDLREAVDTVHEDVIQVPKWVKKTRKSRDKAEKLPETWASRYLWTHSFPGHVLSRYLTEEDVEFRKGLSRKDANGWMNRVVQPANSMLFVVGNIDGEKTEADVREFFTDWAPAKGVETGRLPGLDPAPDPTPRKIYVFDKPGTTQAQVSMMCQLTEATCDNRAARLVLSSLYSDVLWTELRETAGSTYGAYAYQGESRGGPAYMAAGTMIQDRTVDLAIKTMFDALKGLHDGEVDHDKMQTMKWEHARSITTGYQTSSQMLSGLDAFCTRGCGYEGLVGYPEQLAHVAAKELPPLLDRCIGNEVITIVGTADEMVKEVEEAGYTAEVVDWESLIQNPAKDKKKKKKDD